MTSIEVYYGDMRAFLLQKIGSLCMGILLSLGGVVSMYAYAIENVRASTEDTFVLQPAKQEVFINPGESVIKYITVTSKIKGASRFMVSLEDIKGTDDKDRPVALLGGDVGPYTIGEYVRPGKNDFTLRYGERITIPVEVSIPDDAEPGGHYGAIIISSSPYNPVAGGGSTRVVSRVGSMFFIRVLGEVNEGGTFEDFRIKEPKAIYTTGPFTFELLFRNTGSVHVTPYGKVVITNIWGGVVDEIPVDAYFSLPKSLRYRDVLWDKASLFGRYTAHAYLWVGDNDAPYEQTLVFWVLPVKIVVGMVFGLGLVVYTVRFVRRRLIPHRQK